MSARAVLAGYTAWLATLTVAYFAVPSLQVALWAAIGTSGAAAIVVGVYRNRPSRPQPWRLVAFALLAFAVADTATAVLNRRFGAPYPVPLVIDLCYLLMFILLVKGLHGLARSGSRGPDRASLLDAVMLTAAVGLVIWVYLISPQITQSDLPVLDRIGAVGYPLADVLILAMAVRLALAAPWSPPVALLIAGATALFIGDVAYLLAQLTGEWRLGGPLDLTWIALYATWGAAALLPSMTELTRPRVARPSELTARRLVLLALCSLVAPAVLMVEASRGSVRGGPVIALTSAVMFVLVLSRLVGAMRAHRMALARERGLRSAGAALVAATDEAQVAAVSRAAVAQLLPPATDHRTVLSLHDGFHPAGPATELVRVPDLPTPVAVRLAGFEFALCCPLEAHDGSLLIAADEGALVNLHGPVEVLAAQAALALERIALNEEINRRDSEAYFRTLVQNASDVILIVDEDDQVRYASPSAEGVFGRAGLPGTQLPDLVDPPARPTAERTLRRVRDGLAVAADPGDWTVLRADGSRRQVEVSGRDLREDPTVRGLVITLRDVTERRRLEQDLTHQAFHDALTGLANRVLFNARVARAAENVRRNGTVAGVLVIDLDDFKVVNDTLGHPAGDELLIAVADRLTGVLRPQDTACRLGGDEFAALVEHARDPAAIERVAERIINALAAPFRVGGDLVSGVASIGLATTDDVGVPPERPGADGGHGAALGLGAPGQPGADRGGDPGFIADELLRQADLALYVAKAAGKGQWRRYQPALHTVLVERMHLRAELDRAVAAREFSLRYQPVVGLTDSETIGFEALVRWEHPTRGTLLPAEFIEVAEQTGLIVPIGNLVLEQAVATAARWRAETDAAPYVSINVSARQFRTPGFVEEVRRQLARTSLPPDRLLLEITENLLIREDEQVWTDLAELRRLGVWVAIDDFGTGYSSLSYLRQVPLNVLKIDRSFIGTMASSVQQRALVKGIVQIAHTLGLEVIAEGIESTAEREILLEAGCPYGQGYLFSKPLTSEEATRWLLAAAELSGRPA